MNKQRPANQSINRTLAPASGAKRKGQAPITSIIYAPSFTRANREKKSTMAPKLYPLSFRCDCGHQSDFFEKTVREMEKMSKNKKKLTKVKKQAQKAAKAERQKKYEWVFMNGKQVRVKRRPMVDGMDMDEFILRNADPIWLHQNEMWEYIEIDEDREHIEEDDIPF